MKVKSFVLSYNYILIISISIWGLLLQTLLFYTKDLCKKENVKELNFSLHYFIFLISLFNNPYHFFCNSTECVKLFFFLPLFLTYALCVWTFQLFNWSFFDYYHWQRDIIALALSELYIRPFCKLDNCLIIKPLKDVVEQYTNVSYARCVRSENGRCFPTNQRSFIL